MNPRDMCSTAGSYPQPTPSFDAATLTDLQLMECVREAAQRANRVQSEAEERVAALRNCLTDPLGQKAVCSNPPPTWGGR